MLCKSAIGATGTLDMPLADRLDRSTAPAPRILQRRSTRGNIAAPRNLERMSLLSELKRRNVYRVAALYIIVGWVVLQVVDLFTSFMPLPEWTSQLVFVLLVAGFPVSLVLAWAIELTPEGLRLDAPVDRSPTSRRRSDLLLVGGVGVVLGIGIWNLVGGSVGESVEVRSIVVLPLDNLMNDPEQAYFVEGMHEALITELSKVEALRVISRTSAMKYLDSDKSVPEIGQELGVDAVLEGSVLRAGETVRVTAQLIEAATDRHIWADNFDRELTDILALYAEVTREIVDRIRIEVTPEQAARLATTAPVDPEAYELYLRGTFLCEKWAPQEMLDGIEHLRRAVAADPEYALAHAGLAICLQYAAFFDYIPPIEILREAMAAANRAVELDRDLTDAWVAFAGVRYYLDFDFAASELALERALSLNPSHVGALTHFSWQLGEAGRTKPAVEAARKAIALDPLTTGTRTTLAQALYLGGDFVAAKDAYEVMVDLDPTDPSGHYYLGWALEQTGGVGAAVTSLETAVELSGREPLYLSGLGRLLGVAGRLDEARAIQEEIQALERNGLADPIHVALVHLGLRNDVEAIDWLEKAYDTRNSHLLYIKQGAQFDPLRGDPRFEALIRRMGW
jgi:TolB-like protein/Flp pilus assembly protein TadD